jgi:hypothetical protein
MPVEYVHPRIAEEVEAISGHYTVVKEAVLEWEGRELIYHVAVGVFDRTCCGTAGCSYAVTPGFLVAARVRLDPEGNPVSLVEPLRDEELQKKIAGAIQVREMVGQVIFL